LMGTSCQPTLGSCCPITSFSEGETFVMREAGIEGRGRAALPMTYLDSPRSANV
jgi:hypothetical protein